ncbi:hypothetical protein P8452_52212 [Trifolium repens]|nr:hypothetical protein P8452_52212 [Trifolium repens]
MKNGNGSRFDILAKANTDLLHRLHRVKLENEKSRRNNPTNPGNTNVGNFQRLDRQRKKVEENKGVQNTDIRKVKASKKNVQASTVKQNNNLKRPERSTMESQVQGSTIDQQASKKIKSVQKCPAIPITEYLNKNKEQDRVDELDDEDIEESEMGEDIDINMNYEGEEIEENKGVQNTDIRKVKASKKGSMVRQNNNHKRPVKSTMENQVQGSTVDQQASKKRKTVPKCPAVPITEYLNKNKEQGGVDELDDEDIEESEMGEDIETDMNYEGEEIEGTNVNTAEGFIRKRGKTLSLISAPTTDANSEFHSLTSTHAPNDNEMMNNDDINEDMQDFEDEE